jgi:hypothetical protein
MHTNVYRCMRMYQLRYQFTERFEKVYAKDLSQVHKVLDPIMSDTCPSVFELNDAMFCRIQHSLSLPSGIDTDFVVHTASLRGKS